MTTLPALAIGTPVGLLAYSYIVYPAVLKVLSLRRRPAGSGKGSSPLPSITITIPCHNEERAIGDAIERLLAIDYPEDLRKILVVSDASTDRTDEIVASYAGRGVELLRLTRRGGKTAAENAAASRVQGDLVVNIDATIHIAPGALRALVAVFSDPTIGVASGRDVSVGDPSSTRNAAESGYVGYEMWVRSLETRLGSIVGASGCFFAIRRQLYQGDFPEALSRDFASCLVAREHGYRSVSVDAAIAHVPRSSSLQAEYRRKVRTMARGLGTLWFKRHLLNPVRFGTFSWMLFSHKLSRWLFQLTLPLLAVGAVFLALEFPALTPWLAASFLGFGGVAVLSWVWPSVRPMPRALAMPGYVIWSTVAGLMAWAQFFLGRYQPVWEPTRRPEIRN